jgi:hypothetical protein
VRFKDVEMKILAVWIFLLPILTWANEKAFSEAQVFCAEIGFKKNTEKFQNCVLDIYEKNKDVSTSNVAAQKFTDINVYSECMVLGFRQGSSELLQCYTKLKEIKSQQLIGSRAIDSANTATSKAVEIEQAKILLGIAAQGFGLAAGQNQQGRNPVILNQPVQPPVRFITPSGNSYNCTTMGSSITCR